MLVLRVAEPGTVVLDGCREDVEVRTRTVEIRVGVDVKLELELVAI